MALSLAVLAVIVIAAGVVAGASATLIVFELIYVGVAGAAIAILYLDVVNVAETSLHMHVLLRVAWGEKLTLDALVEQYSARHMIEERLTRLTGIGQAVQDGERYYIKDRSVLAFSRILDFWKRLLKLPTSPGAA